jgi:hypothetical protein
MPDAFRRLTVREFRLKWAGFKRAEKRREWLVGRLALLTTDYGKKRPVTPEQLLGWGMDVIRYPVKRWLQPK